MAKPGPQKTPTAILKRRGSWRAETRPDEPAALPDPPAMPTDLGDVAQAAWDHYEPLLQRLGVLSESDGLALELLCRTYQDWHEAREAVIKHGAVEHGPKGGIAERPEVRQRDRAADRLTRLLHEFGLSPAARGNVKITAAPNRKKLPMLGGESG